MAVEPLMTRVEQLTPTRLTHILRHHGILSSGEVPQVDLINKTVTWVSERCQLAIKYSANAVGDQLPRKLFLRLCNPTY